MATVVAPTPPNEDQPNNAYACYVPHDLKYSAEFEDSLIDIVLRSAVRPDGIRVIPEESTEEAVSGVSVRAADVSLHSLPAITEDELPLPLDDPRRVFASPVPGIKLTHPRGYLEGGPGLDPEMDTFPEDFITNHSNITGSAALQEAVQAEIQASIEQLKKRLQARREAAEKNAQIEKKLELMGEAHNMEFKVHRRLAEERRAKREAKERRKVEREVG